MSDPALDFLIASGKCGLDTLLGDAFLPPTILVLLLCLVPLVLALDLQGVRVNLESLDLVYGRHVLLIMLLSILLAAKLLDLEELQPSLVSKHLRAEGDHFRVDRVVRRDLANEEEVTGLDV